MSSDSLPEIFERVRLRTPARLFAGRSGGAYRTAVQLELRAAHAAARDAVRSDFNLEERLGARLIQDFSIFEVGSSAHSKDEYLLRPDLGRRLTEQSRQIIASNCSSAPDLQIIIGDGLSTTAVAAQVPQLLPLLSQGAKQRNWALGRPFAVRFCRVGVLNDVGDLLTPKVAVLLIGERPGLATAESLSAYMAFQPRSEHTDADRNLISNIHARGVSIGDAANRILKLASQMMFKKISGTQIREELPSGILDQLRS
jgi:ethanolamine ammonia-lyase small subunit